MTPTHPLYVEGSGWTPAGDLAPGMYLRTDTGSIAIDMVESAQPNQRVYNVEVGLEHAYRVSASGVWAHNACPGRGGGQQRLKQIAEDPNTSSADRGWIKQEQNSIARGRRSRCGRDATLPGAGILDDRFAQVAGLRVQPLLLRRQGSASRARLLQRRLYGANDEWQEKPEAFRAWAKSILARAKKGLKR